MDSRKAKSIGIILLAIGIVCAIFGIFEYLMFLPAIVTAIFSILFLARSQNLEKEEKAERDEYLYNCPNKPSEPPQRGQGKYCGNCGAKISTKFCPDCGQAATNSGCNVDFDDFNSYTNQKTNNKNSPIAGRFNSLSLEWRVTIVIAFIVIAIFAIGTIIKGAENYLSDKTTDDILGNSKQTTQAVAGKNPTMGEKNALASAKQYLTVTAFSYTGIINQLEYEGFSYAEAKYGADNCGANWYEQAEKSAKQYLKVSSFSRSGLINQLEHEGFTTAQAEYAVNAVGY